MDSGQKSSVYSNINTISPCRWDAGSASQCNILAAFRSELFWYHSQYASLSSHVYYMVSSLVDLYLVVWGVVHACVHIKSQAKFCMSASVSWLNPRCLESTFSSSFPIIYLFLLLLLTRSFLPLSLLSRSSAQGRQLLLVICACK